MHLGHVSGVFGEVLLLLFSRHSSAFPYTGASVAA